MRNGPVLSLLLGQLLFNSEGLVAGLNYETGKKAKMGLISFAQRLATSLQI